MRGGEGEMADAVRCGEGNREDEVVENDRISVEIEDDGFSDSIELEDNDVDLEDDDAENRKEARKMTISTPVLQSQEFISVGSQPPTQGIQSQDANVMEEQVIY
ncbi:hypothetical protein Salat_2906300 [Sesamum alatum]|uniref:Uncharacterized protein n=1 Tax=Sesamum alatum TaxID=300844 RepID=A0AAE2C862_9LAMI|nr:hypothetical protein Salat_2906300 [Sesamum alatum]